MADPVLNLDEAPEDPILRLRWLGGVMDVVRTELAAEFQRTYFQARLEQRLDTAVKLRIHRPRRIVEWTRHENEARGRPIRWGDGY